MRVYEITNFVAHNDKNNWNCTCIYVTNDKIITLWFKMTQEVITVLRVFKFRSLGMFFNDSF